MPAEVPAEVQRQRIECNRRCKTKFSNQPSLNPWSNMKHYGLDFEDGMAPLLDFRFADDLLISAASKEEVIFMLEELMGALQEIGLVLTASKTFVLTTEVQPPTRLRLQNGAEVSVLPRDCCHKWLGSFLTTKNVQRPALDVEHHLQSVARAWFVHKWMLCDKSFSVGFTPEIFQCCYHYSRLFCSRSPNTIPKGRAKVRH